MMESAENNADVSETPTVSSMISPHDFAPYDSAISLEAIIFITQQSVELMCTGKTGHEILLI